MEPLNPGLFFCKVGKKSIFCCMAKKKSKQSNAVTPPGNRQVSPPNQPQAKPKHMAAPALSQQKQTRIKPSIQALIVAGIAVITWLFLKVCTHNQLTNWDDPGYINGNPVIKDISPEGLKAIFTTSVMGNYHPLTILSYAIEYSYVRLDPWLYHFDSLLFHIIVTVLVYWFVNLLTRRPVAAAITALLFGLHPMHVESVAWISGRKDVVYGMFYMAACIAYVYYLRARGAGRLWLYIAVLILFVCSLLGKPVAVVLPVTLLLIDYFEKRKWKEWDGPFQMKKPLFNYWILIEKIPFFIIALIFGEKSIQDQKTFGSLDAKDLSYNFMERIALGGYAFVSYLRKAIIPAGLCNFYPYPPKVNGSLDYYYYFYPLAALVIIFVVWFFGRRSRAIVFGALFFVVNIVLLLQFIPVGGAILADRYSYIAYMGLFLIAGWLVSGFFEPGGNKQLGYVVLSISLVYALFLGYLGNERCKVWYDTTSLWRDEIEKEPHDAPNAWNNLGFNYFNKFNESVNNTDRKIYYDSAYYLLNEAITLQPTFANPYISLGELERSVGNFQEAKKNYYKAISLKSFDEDQNAYLGLAIIYAISHNFDSSAYCFRIAIQLHPHFPEAHSNFGNFFDMTGKPDSALVQYGIAIEQNPDMYAPHLNRGRLLQRLNRNDEAMKDFEAALALSPDNGEVYYARSHSYAAKGNKAQALQDVQKAIALGFTGVDNNYYQSLKN